MVEALKVEEGGEDGLLRRCFIVIWTALPSVQPSPATLHTLSSPSLGRSPHRTGKAQEMLFRAAERSPRELLSDGLLAEDGELTLEKAVQEDKASLLFGLEY